MFVSHGDLRRTGGILMKPYEVAKNSLAGEDTMKSCQEADIFFIAMGQYSFNPNKFQAILGMV